MSVELTDKDEDDCGTVKLTLTFEPLAEVQAAVPGKWKAGGPIRGHLKVHVHTGSGIANPEKVVDVSQQRSLYVQGGLLVLFYFGINAAVFKTTSTTTHEATNLEGPWTFVDTLYFGIVTITTTGYGDLLPSSHGAKIFSGLWAYLGVVIISSVLSFFIANLMEKSAIRMVDEVANTISEEMPEELSNSVCARIIRANPIPGYVLKPFGCVLL